jgi:hypothetical protein
VQKTLQFCEGFMKYSLKVTVLGGNGEYQELGTETPLVGEVNASLPDPLASQGQAFLFHEKTARDG